MPMIKITLTPRLAACAGFAAGSDVLCDVGTDHGYLPISLLLAGKIKYAVAADIRRGPLESAKRHAIAAGCGENMRFELADGLDFPGAEGCDAVVCAGMGGETIAGILARAPWARERARLILQPQSKPDELCVWLRDNGYGIRAASLAAEGKRLYVALCCEGGATDALYAEDALSFANDPLLPAWIKARSERIERALAGMERSESAGEEIEAAKAALDRLSGYTGR